MTKATITINPLNYNLTLIQIESLAAEYFGKCLEPANGDELEIEFNSIGNKNLFTSVLIKTFQKSLD